MTQFNLKALISVFLTCILLLVIAIIYVAIASPYGDLTKIKVYNLEIMMSLISVLGIFVGALLGLAMAKKKDEDEKK